MFADFFPAAELDALAARHENLWLYVDDAHAASWTGRDGRGYALEHLSPATLERTVVALSLNKSFAAAGGVLTFPDAESRRLVATVGGPMIFSGPVQPPMLGAILASARLHRTPEIAALQELLISRIRLFNRLAARARLPLVSESEAPIRYVGAGVASVAYRLTERLRGAGFFVNTAAFPAVPAKRCGVRLTLTAHHTEGDVAGVVAALAEHLPAALADEGSTVEDLRRAFTRELRGRPEILPVARATPSPLRLEHVRSVLDVKSAEWNARLGDRGAFDVTALRTLEAVFGIVDADSAGPAEDQWDFHYLTVRDADGAAVALTFFTTALWKDDMLSPAPVSREVERRRAEAGDPLFLTSPMVGMGSLLTEGDHLWLDRSRDWRAALRLILQAARAEEDRVGAAAVVLRDLPDGDEELHDFLVGEGLLRIPVFDSWVRDVDFTTDEEFLAGLPRRHRYHQRNRVLNWEAGFRIEVLAGGSPAAEALPAATRDHLYTLYRAVHARAFDLNVFPLPRRLLDAVLGFPGWEIVLLHLPERPRPAGGLRRPARRGLARGTGVRRPGLRVRGDAPQLPAAAAPGAALGPEARRAPGALRDERRPAQGPVRGAPGAAVGLRPAHRDLQRRRPRPPGGERAHHLNPHGLPLGQSVPLPLRRVRRSSFAARRARLRAASASVSRSRERRSSDVGHRHRQQQPEQQAGEAAQSDQPQQQDQQRRDAEPAHGVDDQPGQYPRRGGRAACPGCPDRSAQLHCSQP